MIMEGVSQSQQEKRVQDETLARESATTQATAVEELSVPRSLANPPLAIPSIRTSASTPVKINSRGFSDPD